MNTICQNCKKDFVIDERDQNYYAKIGVPSPTWCPECRLIRRFAFQNTWNLNWRACAKCGNRTLSVFAPEQALTVYCQPCWWKDDWDGTEYAMDYDPSRPFLEQMKELSDKTPYSALTSLYTSLTNSGYSNALAWSKDCYFVFWADFCENVYNGSLLNTLKNSADCLRGFTSDLCYEDIGISRCYRTFHSMECDDCVDVWFSRNCYNCTNCIGCANLRGESYMIFNEKYSKEDYAEKLKELELDSWSGQQAFRKQADAFWLSEPQREYSGNSMSVNVTGDYIYESKNSDDMYISNGAEDSRYCQFITVAPARDCYDYSGWGNNSTRIYESVTVGENSGSVFFSLECWPDCLDLQYCIWNISGKNNFGCVNLKKKQYCILNKQYSKEEFERLRAVIIEDMKRNPYTDGLGRKFPYGEFFPVEFSKFPYNKSNAGRFFSMTEAEAKAQGHEWLASVAPTSPATIQAQALPDTIAATDDSILEAVIECGECQRSYKIPRIEYDLLRKMGLPIPHGCPKCRDLSRFVRLTPIKLWQRTCAQCGKAITTAFAPDRPEIVYCTECYQQEFV